MKKRFVSFFLLLSLLCALLPVAVFADGGTVDLYTKDGSAAKVWTVQIASGTQSNCETCVKRLRDAGWNPFLYRETGKGNCRICVGIFGSAAEAETVAKVLHEGPAVKGVNVEKAYGTKIQPGTDCEYRYADPYWGSGPKAAAATPKPADGSVPVDIYGNGSEKIYAVQVAASTSDANSKTCIGRLRDAGYNAYVFKPNDKQRYQLVIGAFPAKGDAQWLVDELHDHAPVRGVSVEKAFIVCLYVPVNAVSLYSETDYNARLRQQASAPAATPSPTAAPDPVLGDVELFYQDDGGEKGVAIQVASSGNLSACVTCIKRLRSAGYNAYLFVPSGQSHYKLCIGFFGSKNDAGGLLNQIKNGPAVKGVSMSGAYLVNTWLPADRGSFYSDWSY